MKIEIQDHWIDGIVLQSLDDALGYLNEHLDAAKRSIESGEPYSMGMYHYDDPMVDRIKIQELVDAMQKVKEYYQP